MNGLIHSSLYFGMLVSVGAYMLGVWLKKKTGWAIQKKNIPSLTIEVGRGTNPLEMSQLPAIYEQNKNVIGEILYGLRK